MSREPEPVWILEKLSDSHKLWKFERNRWNSMCHACPVLSWTDSQMLKTSGSGEPSSIYISNTYLLVFPRVLVYLGGRVGVVKSPVSKAHEWGEWVLSKRKRNQPCLSWQSAKVSFILKFLAEKGKPQKRKKFKVWTIQLVHFFYSICCFFSTALYLFVHYFTQQN